MTPSQVEAYVQDAKLLFANYMTFLEKRIEGMQKAQGESINVTLWLAYMAQFNTQRVLNKLDLFENQITEKTTPEMTEKTMQHITAKVTAHLLRAQEMLEKQAANSSMIALYIPMPGHRDQKEHLLKVKEECDNVLKKHLEAIEEINKIEQNKSWLNKVLDWGLKLVGIRICAHELPNELRVEALKSLTEIAQQLQDMEKTQSLPPTKVTQRTLGCSVEDPTPTTEIHFQYFPKDLKEPISNFMALMEKKDKYITKESVLEAVKVNFPKP